MKTIWLSMIVLGLVVVALGCKTTNETPAWIVVASGHAGHIRLARDESARQFATTSSTKFYTPTPLEKAVQQVHFLIRAFSNRAGIAATRHARAGTLAMLDASRIGADGPCQQSRHCPSRGGCAGGARQLGASWFAAESHRGIRGTADR